MNRKIPKPMLNTLAREATPTEHPSADVLAAFVERALAEGEKQSVTDHLARCGKCREVVFLASGAIEPAVTDEPSVAAKPGWRWTSRWVWAIPVAAMFILGAGYLVRKSYVAAPAEREIASTKIPEKGSDSPERLPEATPTPPPPAATAASPMAKARPKTAPATTQPARKTPPGNANLIVMNAPPAPAERETVNAKSAPPKPSSEAPVIAIGGAVAGPAPAAPRANGFAPTTGESDRQFSTDSLSLSVNRGLAGVARITHPGWRVTTQGYLEHLTPEGWSRVLADQTSAFRVVSVMGSDVWAGGNDGMLFHSVNGGVHWNKVSIASSGGSEGAIMSIRFDDAQHGVVLTDTGASYSTTDGGASWTKQ
jgi:Photosynthesis system II assembly factor YCF48